MSIHYQDGHFNQKLTVLNDAKLRLYGDLIEGNQPGRLPFAYFDFRGNNPRLRAILNNGKKGDEGTITLNLDIMVVFSILEAIKEACNSSEPTVRLFEVKKQGFDQATRKPKEPYTYAVIAVGKNTDGVEFIGIQRGNENRKDFAKCTFYFMPPEFHQILDKTTMQPLPKNKTSNIMARAYASLLTRLMPLIAANVWEYQQTPEAKRLNKTQAQGAGENGTYRSNNNNNSSNYNSSTNYVDSGSTDLEDINW